MCRPFVHAWVSCLIPPPLFFPRKWAGFFFFGLFTGEGGLLFFFFFLRIKRLEGGLTNHDVSLVQPVTARARVLVFFFFPISCGQEHRYIYFEHGPVGQIKPRLRSHHSFSFLERSAGSFFFFFCGVAMVKHAYKTK